MYDMSASQSRPGAPIAAGAKARCTRSGAGVARQACPHFSLEREGDRHEDNSRPRRAPDVGRREVAERLREDAALAGCGGAAEAVDAHALAHAALTPGEIAEAAHIGVGLARRWSGTPGERASAAASP